MNFHKDFNLRNRPEVFKQKSNGPKMNKTRGKFELLKKQ